MSATVTMEYAAEAVELQSLSKSNPTVHTTRSFPDPLNTRNVSEGSASSDTESSSELRASQASSLRTFLAIFTPSFVGFIASFTSGIITVGLPEIARSLSLDRSLYLWPSSVYGLTSGATLLIAGSIADIVGARSVELLGITLLGITLLGVFTLACGFSTAGEQLVVFRALQGVALGMHLPASVSLISGAVPSGRARNFGFACLGFSQPLGFAAGLVLSGIMIQRAGWRSGFYVSGGVTLAVALAAVWTLPKPKTKNTDSVRELWKRVVKEIDWVGGAISSGGLAILAYVLA
jgi:MFS family permease